MSQATLYGVGVGPGATDLLTYRAKEILCRVPVLALPRSNDYGASMAWSIIAPVVEPDASPEQTRLFLTFPMKFDPQTHQRAWEKAFAAIEPHLMAGRDVAFAAEGDPTLFSSFIYLQQEAKQRWPQVKIEVVPGVSSVMAVPSITQVPLADGQERVAILPGTCGYPDLEEVLDRFDTVVLMKMGPEIPRVIEILEKKGLLSKARFVSRATMREQRVVEDVRELSSERGGCFAMMIIAKKERNGVLGGQALPLSQAGGQA